MHLDVADRGSRPARARPTRVPAGVLVTRRESTYVAPVSDPGGRARAETWEATTRDGLWSFARGDEDTTPWTVTYLPTGQMSEGYGTLARAYRATATGLIAELRGAARVEAFDAGLDEGRRAEAHRWLAIHMRIAGADEVDALCACGGWLVVATRDGRYAHVDACDDCHGAGEPVAGCDHGFCGTPRIVTT